MTLPRSRKNRPIKKSRIPTIKADRGPPVFTYLVGSARDHAGDCSGHALPIAQPVRRITAASIFWCIDHVIFIRGRWWQSSAPLLYSNKINFLNLPAIFIASLDLPYDNSIILYPDTSNYIVRDNIGVVQKRFIWKWPFWAEWPKE